jgi:hypothetical protein
MEGARRGATKLHLAAAGILLAAAAFGPPARAQTVDPDIVPQIPLSETVDVVGAVAGARISLSKDSGATVGALYGAYPGNDLTGAFAIGDHALDRHWSIIGGYVMTRQIVKDGPDATNHMLRVGVVYKHDFGRLTLDDRLLYEAILTGQGRPDGNRLRNRFRLTYQLAPDARSHPRLFGYAEPVFDDRADGLQSVNYTVGASATFGRFDADLYYTRIDRRARSAGDIDGLTLQLIYKFPAPHR